MYQTLSMAEASPLTMTRTCLRNAREALRLTYFAMRMSNKSIKRLPQELVRRNQTTGKAVQAGVLWYLTHWHCLQKIWRVNSWDNHNYEIKSVVIPVFLWHEIYPRSSTTRKNLYNGFKKENEKLDSVQHSIGRSDTLALLLKATQAQTDTDSNGSNGDHDQNFKPHCFDDPRSILLCESGSWVYELENAFEACFGNYSRAHNKLRLRWDPKELH